MFVYFNNRFQIANNKCCLWSFATTITIAQLVIFRTFPIFPCFFFAKQIFLRTWKNTYYAYIINLYLTNAFATYHVCIKNCISEFPNFEYSCVYVCHFKLFSTHFFIRFQSNFSSIWHLQHYDNITVRPTTSSAIMQHIS